ncbi:adenylosuccinate lyase [Wenzhouxiangella marina]|uniref:Adenylosuccinate lyase n=1 Tax=Wenzhouxiangella marina TaxID=1579979 RepID=A0A0K0XW46_9GAMM|nr:adenylosuccinate lyase [Wenzhouxiangella marina]AKS41903.1 adenylosuccinate lyase [Wenzhouxiangella marina]MBB6086330.1 adenylosuccinate lyase [Wenzhouxiangella marina]
MADHALTALSPLDGRYAGRLGELAELCSEAGLIRQRVRVEIAWFKALAAHPEFTALPALGPDDEAFLDAMVEDFGPEQAAAVKAIERTTNHDVKAVEYWIKRTMAQRPGLKRSLEFVHFALTSEDINNLSWALIIQQAIADVLDPLLSRLDERLQAIALETAELPMLSRTHGQTASPTTMGKELANVVFRLRRQRRGLNQVELTGKINGAVGNFNAHLAACPELDWPELSRRVVEDLGLVFNPYTTQIEPHDMIAEVSHALVRVNTILTDFARDVWGYISLGYFRQKLVEGEVGSSTMPHKVNPIDFENGEGNLGLANALLEHLAAKLPISRWQRDLTDSTVQRSLGSAFGYCALAWHSILRGLDRIAADPERLAADLDRAWEVLAEPVQTVMRLHEVPEPYEKLKALTRGHGIDRERLHDFIRKLEIPEADRDRLLAMTPSSYIGNAAEMARAIVRHV